MEDMETTTTTTPRKQDDILNFNLRPNSSLDGKLNLKKNCENEKSSTDHESQDSSSEDEDHLDIATNRDLEAITAGDTNVEITGIVRNLEPEGWVGKKEKSRVLLRKFLLCNEEKKRIKCCIWEKPVIEKLEDIIREGHKIYIMRAQAKLPDMRYFPTNDRNLVPMELHIGKFTEITNHGKYSADSEKPLNYKEVDFQSILENEGPIQIEGYLKQTFTLSSAGSTMSHILNAITDGEHKINVIVKNTAGVDKFQDYKKGDKVRVSGFTDIDDNTGMVEIICNEISQISLIPGAERMSKRKCSAASRPLKKTKTDAS